MRFKASIHNLIKLTRFVASLSSLGKVAWVRLNDEEVRFTVIPEQGTQVWAVLSIDSIFETYSIQSASPNNTINLEVPLQPLQKALRSAISAVSTNIRLTKKNGIPLLSLTIVTTSYSGNPAGNFNTLPLPTQSQANPTSDAAGNTSAPNVGGEQDFGLAPGDPYREREITIMQDVPVRVLSAATVQGLHEPRCREPDVHILLPPLLQLKSISDHFTRLSSATMKSSVLNGGASTASAMQTSGPGPKLELSANMHGCLRLSISTDALSISSVWRDLANPDLDPSQYEGGEEGLRQHPTARMRMMGGDSEESWAKVRIDGKDWSRVLSVGRMGGRVIACFCHNHALILYVYLPNEDDLAEESVLTYYISSYSV
ncbi:Hus1-like protein [Xylona heveae TC161]|uniref:Checkpoint protein n=1 Tax=Xylona heveae (strain CBS 132557 / TC161) TaxID=1328760 RepID=A0A165FUN1_XYLHT|nr:Hus1-like protein [Xylona heveae TC161]KZF21401.1 Hus1-like protein [Xylona heveae TC161]